MIRVSAGSASIMGLKRIRMKELPTTAYFMLGKSCANSCAYCSQGNNYNNRKDKLSRVTWPEYDINAIIEGIKEGERKGLKRICIQELRDFELYSEDNLVNFIKLIKENSSLPLSLSSNAKSMEEIEKLFGLGLDKIGISLDVCNSDKYSQYKGGSFKERLELIKQAGSKFPGKVSTHIIVGLGEKDLELLSVVDSLLKSKVEVALFAFMPLDKTPLAHKEPPTLVRYRKIQAAYYLLREQYISLDKLIFDLNNKEEKESLAGFRVDSSLFVKALDTGEVFKTTGCSGCNRPLYNENPREIPYNYPRPLTRKEKDEAINLLLDNLIFFPGKIEGEIKNEKMATDC